MKKPILITLSLLFVFTTGTFGQTTSRCTNWTMLDGTGNLGNRSAAPAPTVFKVPGVRVKKCLKVNRITGEVTQTCKFENTSNQAVKFMFCNMIELNSTFPTTTHNNNCNIKFDAATMKWKCEASSGTNTAAKGLHFGCKVVELAKAGAPNGKDKKTTTEDRQSADFIHREAKDFEVAYADVFNLAIADTTVDCGYQAGTCTNCFGSNKSTNIGTGTDREDASGYWIMSDIPITDPFCIWQDLSGVRHRLEYYSLSTPLSVTSDFPVNHPDLGRTDPTTVPPFQYAIDLLLWDIFVMSPTSNDSLPVEVRVFVDTLPPEVSIEAIPLQTTLPGGSMEYGQILVSQPGLGLVPEGAKVNFVVAIVDPQMPDSITYWSQAGLAVQDTTPPFILQHSVIDMGNGNLSVFIQAEDTTSYPIDANFYYTLDDGANWNTVPLNAAINPVEASPTNTFSDTIATGGSLGEKIDYFFNVQDGVLNQTWYGPGQEVLNSLVSPEAITFISASPNPASGEVRFQFKLSRTGLVKLQLFDQMGRLVKDLYKGKVGSRTEEVIHADINDLMAGLYFYRLEMDNGKYKAGKLVIVEK